MLGGQDHRPGGIVDADDFQLDAVHHERQLAEHRARDEGAVRGAAPVATAVGRGHAHRDGGQAGLGDVAHHQVFGLHPGLHVGSQPARVDHVVLGRDVAMPPAHRRVGAGEDEPAQAGFFDGDVEDVAQTFDVGAEQRRRVTQPGAGVDDAVVDVVDAVHRLAHRGGVEHVAVEAGEFEVVDGAGVGVGAHHGPYFGTVGDQLAGDVRTQKAVGADDQFGFCVASGTWVTGAPPFSCIHRAASSSSVPSACALRHHFIAACRKRSGL